MNLIFIKLLDPSALTMINADQNETCHNSEFHCKVQVLKMGKRDANGKRIKWAGWEKRIVKYLKA